MKNILLVDDDTFLLEMYEKKFKNSDYQTETAVSGDEALTLLRGGLVVDCIILDVTMPGTSGIAVLEALNKEKLIPKALRVMLTNQGSDEEIQKAKDLGIQGYIVKAAAIPSEVVTEVAKIIKRHSNTIV